MDEKTLIEREHALEVKERELKIRDLELQYQQANLSLQNYDIESTHQELLRRGIEASSAAIKVSGPREPLIALLDMCAEKLVERINKL